MITFRIDSSGDFHWHLELLPDNTVKGTFWNVRFYKFYKFEQNYNGTARDNVIIHKE